MCGQHTARDNTRQNTVNRNTYPVPREKLKFLTPPVIEPGCRAGLDHVTTTDLYSVYGS